MDIISALANGNIHEIISYLELNPDYARDIDENGNTLLHRAAALDRSTDLELLNWLIENGANVNAVNKQGATPLHLAANRTDTEFAVFFLLEGGADVNNKLTKAGSFADYADTNALQSETTPDIMKNLSEMFGTSGIEYRVDDSNITIGKDGFEITLPIPKHNQNLEDFAVNIIGATPLHFAANNAYDAVGIVEYILDKGADINARTADGTSPILLAISNEHEETATMLIERGADVNLPNEETGVTPLMMAVMRDNDELVQLLISGGADPNAQSPDLGTALHISAMNGNCEIAKLLADHGADLNIRRSEEGITPLYTAVYYGHYEMLELLSSYGADLNEISNTGMPLIWSAILLDKDNVVDALLDCGVNANRQYEEGMTALMLAASNGKDLSMIGLLEHGADPTIKNTSGTTALELAQSEMDMILMKSYVKKAPADHKSTSAGAGCSTLALLFIGTIVVLIMFIYQLQ